MRLFNPQKPTWKTSCFVFKVGCVSDCFFGWVPQLPVTSFLVKFVAYKLPVTTRFQNIISYQYLYITILNGKSYEIMQLILIQGVKTTRLFPWCNWLLRQIKNPINTNPIDWLLQIFHSTKVDHLSTSSDVTTRLELTAQ